MVIDLVPALRETARKALPRRTWDFLAFVRSADCYYREDQARRELFRQSQPLCDLKPHEEVIIAPPESCHVYDIRRSMAYSRDVQRENRDFAKLVKHSQSFMDIGASAGWFSALFAGLRQNAQITSVEPDPNSFRCLEEVREKNACAAVRWSLENVAVSDTPGSMELGLSEFGGDFSCTRMGTRPTTEVNVETLSRLFAKYGTPDVLKIDVEGWEHRFLADIIPTLALNHVRLHLEVHWKICGREDWPTDKMCEAMLRAQPEVIYPARRSIEQLFSPSRERPAIQRCGLAF